MKYFLTIAGLLLLNTCFAQTDPNMLSAHEKNEGWTLLFDGKTTKGWHSFNKAKAGDAWKIKDGSLYLDTARKAGWQTAGGGDLVSENSFSNFDLKMEWKISPGGNSGIMFYVQEGKKFEYPWQTGPEMQIADIDNEDGRIKKHKSGELYALVAGNKDMVKPTGEWNQAEIIANKGSLILLLNGEKIISTTLWDDNWNQLIASTKFKDMPDFGKFRSGKIALQDHGNLVYFRNIRIKEL